MGTVNIGFLTLNQFVIIILFFAALLVKLIQRQDIFMPGALTTALMVFGSYLWFSNFIISQDPSLGIVHSTNFLRSLVCYLLVITLINNKKKIRLLVFSYIAASVAMVLTGDIGAQFTGTFNLYSSGSRSGIEGLAAHYIQYAMYALISFPLAYSLLKDTQAHFGRIICHAVLALLAFATLFSGSRGAVLTFIVMVSAIAIMDLRRGEGLSVTRTELLFFSFITIFLFCLFWVQGGADLMLSLSSLLTDKPADTSLAGRLFMQKTSFNIFLDNPIFGCGIANIVAIYGLVPHNQWLQILSELGLVGMVLAILTVYFIFRSLSAARRNAYSNNDHFIINIVNGLSISIFSMLFWGLYENIGLLTAEKTLFMLFGLSEAIRSYTDTEQTSSVQSHKPYFTIR